MKKTFNYCGMAVFAVVSLCAVSCQKEIEEDRQTVDANGEVPVVTAYAPGYSPDTKTVIMNETEVWWRPEDSINVFYGSNCNLGKFTSISDAAEQSTIFFGEKTFALGTIVPGGQKKFWGIYPYAAANSCDNASVTMTVPSVQTAVAGSFDPMAFPSVATSDDLTFAFYNVCGGVRFSITKAGVKLVSFRGNNGEFLAGKVKVSMSDEGKPVAEVIDGRSEVILVCEDGFAVGEWYFISLLPATLNCGYTMCFDTDTLDAKKVSSTPVTVNRSIFGSLSNADQGQEYKSLVNLSRLGTANSYIVSSSGTYKFQLVKGNSTESVGTVASVAVLWESFGTDTAPSDGDLVNNVSYADGYISFSASDKKGNAVIAAKDASGTILWSWHIWLTDNPEDQVYNNNAGTMMDRNLGATSATPGDVKALGLLYQWGRKDPFLGSSSISSNILALSSGTWPSPVSSDSSNGTIAYAVSHPNTFIKYNGENCDWYYTGSSITDNTRWQTSDKGKGLYDPCPHGYRVPDGGLDGIWSKAFGTSSSWNLSTWDSTNNGMNFGATDNTLGSASTIWYPFTGYISYKWATLNGVGGSSASWSCSPFDYRANYLTFLLSSSQSSFIDPSSKGTRAGGQSVRCLKE